MSEERITSASGGQKGRKPEQFHTMPVEALFELARVYSFGTRKYADYNYRLGYDWSLSFNAMMRHAFSYWKGEDKDPESGLNHMAHVAWHALNLILFAEQNLGKDDRPSGMYAEYRREEESAYKPPPPPFDDNDEAVSGDYYGEHPPLSPDPHGGF